MCNRLSSQICRRRVTGATKFIQSYVICGEFLASYERFCVENDGGLAIDEVHQSDGQHEDKDPDD